MNIKMLVKEVFIYPFLSLIFVCYTMAIQLFGERMMLTYMFILPLQTIIKDIHNVHWQADSQTFLGLSAFQFSLNLKETTLDCFG